MVDAVKAFGTFLSEDLQNNLSGFTRAEWKRTVMHGPRKKFAVLSCMANFKLLALHLKLPFLFW